MHIIYKQVKSTEPYLDLTSYNTMYYITVSIIVILCGGYVSGECNGYYTDSDVNGPPGNCYCYNYYCYHAIIEWCHSWV